MKFLCFTSSLLLGICWGVAAVNMDCLMKTLKCAEIWKLNPLTEDNYCEIQKQVLDCVVEETSDCTVDSKFDLSDLQASLKEMCTEGTELNREFLQHRACLLSSINSTMSCVQFLVDMFKDVKNPTQEDLVKAQIEVCKRFDEIQNCGYDKVEDLCGRAAREFAEKANKAKDKLSRIYCEELMKNKEEITKGKIFPLNIL